MAFNTILSDSSDSDEPLSRLVDAGRTKSRQETDWATENTNKRQLVSSATPSAPKNLSNRPPQSGIPPNPLRGGTSQSDTQALSVTPISSKLRAWKEVGKLIPLGKNRQIPSELEARSSVQPDSPTIAQPQSASFDAEEPPQDPPSLPLFLSDDDDVSVEIGMDVDPTPTPDPISFLQSVVQDIPL